MWDYIDRAQRDAQNPLLNGALAYRRDGLAVFPLHHPVPSGCSCSRGSSCTRIGKHPMTPHGFHDATTDEETIRDWWRNEPDANIGIATGSVIDAVDIDGPDGLALLRSLLGPAERRRPPRSKTGRGWQLIYKSNGKLPSWAGKLGKGLDFRGTGGYIVAPPSVHANGTTYHWVIGLDEGESIPVPPEFIPGASVAAPMPARGAGNSRIPDGQRNVDLASWAGRIHRLGLPAEATLASLQVMNTKWCDPPKPDDEVRRIAASITQYPTGPTATASAHMRARILDDEALATLPSPVALVGDLLFQGTMAVLYGPPGAGKSFVAMDLACSVGAGISWFNHETVSSRVLYVAGEGSAGLGERKRAWQLARGIPATPSVFWLPEPVNIMNHDKSSALSELIGERKITFLIVDTFARSLVGADENAARDVGQAIYNLDQIREETSATVLLIHHPRKDGEIMRGSSSLEGAADTIILCKREGSGVMALTCAKQKDALPFAPMYLKLVAVGSSCALEAAVRSETLPVTRQAALELFVETFAESGATAAVLRDTLIEQHKMGRATAYRVINDLAREGAIANQGSLRRPFYILVPDNPRVSHLLASRDKSQ